VKGGCDLPGQYPGAEIESLIAWREQEESPDIEWIDEPTGSYRCVRGELLVDPDIPDVRGRVPALVDPDLEDPSEIEIGHRMVLHYRSPRIEVGDVLRKARDADDRDSLIPGIRPNLVFAGEPGYQGFPSCWPTPDQPANLDYWGVGDGDGPIVAVLDTGYTVGIHEADGLDSRFGAWGPPQSTERVNVTKPDGWRDFEAGHSTFICGIIAQRARRARLRLVPTLDSRGYVSEAELASNIATLGGDVDIVNLSLGGPGQYGLPPLLLGLAIDGLPAETAVVAAAGNAGPKEHEFWPARFDHEEPCAQKRVFAVGALAEDGTTADYSTEPADLYATGRTTSAFIWFDETMSHPAPVNGRYPHAFDGYASWGGTSFATAVIAARIAEEMADGRSALAVARDLCQSGVRVRL
jgi:Subtilase family